MHVNCSTSTEPGQADRVGHLSGSKSSSFEIPSAINQSVAALKQSANTERASTSQLSPEAAEYECCVCCDLLLDPVVFPCGHDTCFSCYAHWVGQQQSQGISAVCPLCRIPLPGALGVSLRLKKTVETLYPEASKARRYESNQRMQEHAKQLLQQNIGTMAQSSSAYYAQAMMAQWAQMSLAAAVSSGLYPPPQPVVSPRDREQATVGMPVMGLVPQASAGLPLAPRAGYIPNGSSFQQQAASTAPAIEDTARLGEGMHPQGSSSTNSPTARRQRWQSAGDAQLRLDCARLILGMLRERGMQSMLGSKLLPAVRLVEVTLYRTAKTKAAYLDPATLEARVTAFVRHRAAVAAVARRRAAVSAGGGQLGGSPPPLTCNTIPHVASTATLAAVAPVL